MQDSIVDKSPSAAAPALDGRERLSNVSETLRIPLAARALGDTLFPELAVQDAHAGRMLLRMGDDGAGWLRDRHSVYGILARTRRFRELAGAFLARVPDGLVVNLGCGLSDYFQWLDNGRARMIDADLPPVLALRRELLPPATERHALRELDLADPQWWPALGLPLDGAGAPVFLMAEGVAMYLKPEQMQALLRLFGQHAPAGSELAFDAMCWLVAGRAKLHTSVKHTGAQFHWGPRKQAQLAAAHPRLRLIAAHRVMEGYGLPYSALGPLFRALAGVPLYALYQLGAG
ncbi:class I SAM-dependent methyltransferase [Achromobacter sp. Marseille-Q0513]|uniref:class I SAM-dependent methyltransferase n=1 Tax=Achromobacter sp. Marseille-Q0513 TaxID=2829161 RepID=UPI001B8F5D4C|nr:class I SAM-dependent methyltransferase [Achromobacter sp. Marseille-Q0513]MBR8656711.1 class I SAM-dependent methyltransferase [Achromobacter sp. Marseille-Q0513]